MKISKGFAVGMVLCFVAVITLSGVLVFRNKEEKKMKPEAEKQLTQKEEISEEPVTETQSTEVKNEEESVKEPVEEPEESVSSTGEKTQALFFSKTGNLLWPVEGHVILNYSMDQTVYFSTLDQYKYNPALIIGGEVGDEVISAARGIVTDVSETVETGMTVTVELGGGYEVIYGQLMEVTVSPGEYIEKGQAIGKLAEPSRYYSVEGCNLYFQLLKDGESENPIEYLEE